MNADALTRKARSGVLAIVAAALLVSQGRGAEEQRLEYRVSTETAQSGAGVQAAEPPLSEAAPEGLKLPTSMGSDAVFARWQTPMAKAGYVDIAVSKSKKGGSYDTLHVDSNADGSLADEPAIRAAIPSPGWTRFPEVKLAFAPDEGPATYHIRTYIATYTDWSGVIRRRLGVSSACRYEGRVKIGGKEYECTLVDYNSNGTSNDSSMNLWQCDRIRVGGGNAEPRVVGKYIQVDGKLYHLGVARSGAWVRFDEIENAPTGVVEAGYEIDTLAVAGENGHLDVEVRDRRASIPAGKWIPYGWQMKRKDARGVEWSLSGWRFPESAVFEVSEGRKTALGIGESVTAGVSVLKAGDEYSLQETLTGELGERITILRAGAAPPPAKVCIRNADGSYDETFQFQFG